MLLCMEHLESLNCIFALPHPCKKTVWFNYGKPCLWILKITMHFSEDQPSFEQTKYVVDNINYKNFQDQCCLFRFEDMN